jgi:hypothetical protein
MCGLEKSIPKMPLNLLVCCMPVMPVMRYSDYATMAIGNTIKEWLQPI